jgi:asparagine synthase (glutamine-hydrolysing)
MTAFIHLEVNWEEDPQVVGANVRRMLGAVAHYPWRSTSINDLSAAPVCCVMAVQMGSGAAPCASKDSAQAPRVHLAADVHLHARDELQHQLGISPGEARLLSDEDLVLRAYQRWGLACADRILGDGAFALWDAAAQRLVCWRDAAGVRPLYYHHVPGRRLVISSDLQSIAAHPATPSRLDLAYTRAILEKGELFQHPTRTLVDGVLKVPPAHVLTFDRDGLHLQPYWDPDNVPEKANAHDGESIEELRGLLRQAIDARLRHAGEGVGAHLSGGIDSSSIAVMAAALLEGRGQSLSTFSWAPPRDVVPAVEFGDERDLVDAVARFAALRLQYTRLQPGDIVDFAYRDVALRPRVTLNFEVATSRQAVDAGVRTMLSGWGGDEAIAFNGRGYFADMARRGRFATVHRELRLRSRIHGGTLRGAWKHRVLRPLLPDFLLGRRSKELRRLPAELRPEFAHLLRTVEPLKHIYPRERPGVHRMQVSLLRFGHLHHRMEAWAAHGAALGLTYTFPLVDRRVMEFALSLPGRMFFRAGWKRWLYRTAMEGILPDHVRWNPIKFDYAAASHLAAVRREPFDAYREALLERRANPLVDVGVLVAAQDRSRQRRLSPNGSADLPSEYVGPGAWLAFTRLQPA